MPASSYSSYFKKNTVWHQFYQKIILNKQQQQQQQRQLSSWLLATAAGAVMAIPAVAMGQGCFFLLRYRWYYAGAPHPIIPSRGCVVCYNNNSSSCCCCDDETKKDEDDTTNTTSPRPPLRLLVVGDSLAMGIGMKESATPILPETIAQCLSQKLGRSVEWTCIGKPGLTAHNLVIETEEFLLKQEEEVQNNNTTTNKNNSTMIEEGNSNHHHHDTTSDEWKEWKRRTTTRGNTTTTTTRKKKYGSHHSHYYDVIVALVGIGDLKASFLPSFISATPVTNRGFGSDLHRFQNLFASSSSSSIVVLPALPIRPVPIFQYPPLSWFVSPLLSRLEQEKQNLAQKRNSTGTGTTTRVVFIDEPTDQMIQDFEHNRGPLVDMMKKKKKKNDDDQDGSSSTTTTTTTIIHDTPLAIRLKLKEKMKEFSKGQSSSSSSSSSSSNNNIGATLVALDQIHPNDQCYDFWGRHIASKLLMDSESFFVPKK